MQNLELRSKSVSEVDLTFDHKINLVSNWTIAPNIVKCKISYKTFLLPLCNKHIVPTRPKKFPFRSQPLTFALWPQKSSQLSQNKCFVSVCASWRQNPENPLSSLWIVQRVGTFPLHCQRIHVRVWSHSLNLALVVLRSAVSSLHQRTFTLHKRLSTQPWTSWLFAHRWGAFTTWLFITTYVIAWVESVSQSDSAVGCSCSCKHCGALCAG